MNRTAPAFLLFAFVLVPATAPVQAEHEPQTNRLTVTNAPDGYVFPGDHTQQCDGQLALGALDHPGCDFEDDVRDGLGLLAVGFRIIDAGNTGPVPLTGRLTAHLSSEAGEMRWTCSWKNGAWMGCSIEPQLLWPEYGEPFTFDCYSEPGAIGNWGECFVTHA